MNSVKADYSSFFGVGAVPMGRNTILVVLGCSYKLKDVQSFATHENGS